MLSVNGSTRKELLSLPRCKWDDKTKEYDSIMILSKGVKHDSGWGIMVIIGCIHREPKEIAAECPDHIMWNFSANPEMDCALPSRAMHFFLRGQGKFRVGMDISSVDIHVG